MDSDFIVDKACFERGCACYDPRDGGEVVSVPRMEITIEVREVYGHKKFYPACTNSKVFASIAGTTTLTEATVRRIMQLGYKAKTKQLKNEFEEGEMK
jgi:hypothetical protein